MAKELGFLYLNGLGDGKGAPQDRLVRWWWRLAGLNFQHAHINWYDGKDLKEKLITVEQKVDKMLGSFEGVAIIGSSAGGSLALNSYYRQKDKNVCAVIAHGRLRAGSYPNYARMSLYRRAHLDASKRPSQSFYDSVKLAESIIPKLSKKDKERVLVLTQLTDMVVPMECTGISGVATHRSLAFGHSGAFVAHFIADRNIITKFAHKALAHQ